MDTQTNIQFEPQPNENNNNIVTFNYEGTPISFNRGDAVMVNATEMAKPFGKEAKHWLQNQSTNEFLTEISKVRNLTFADLVHIRVGAPATGGGTWMHEDVAMEFARWLSPKFAIWCNDKIKELLTTGVATVTDDDDVIANAMAILQKRLEQKQQQLRQVQEENKRLTPKAAWTDHQIGNDEMLYGWEQAAKHLKLRSAKKLTTFCLDHELVFRRYDSKNKRWDYFPHAKFTEQGYFRVIQDVPKHRDGTPVINQYTGQPCNPKRELKITEYGLVFLQSQLENAGLVKPVFNKDEQ